MFVAGPEDSPALNRTDCSLCSQSYRRGGGAGQTQLALNGPLDHSTFLGVWSLTTLVRITWTEGKERVFKCRFPDATQELLIWNVCRGGAQESAFYKLPGDPKMKKHQSTESSLGPPSEQLW